MTATSDRFEILGYGLWLAGFPSATSWVSGARDEAASKPLGLALDRMNRRRGSLLARALADAAAEAMAQAGVDPSQVAMIVGSSIGEASSMIGLLDQMWRTREPVSPAAFTMSVHNAASGLISISNGNRGLATSIAADEDTPAAALIEAIGIAATLALPVVVVCADETPPPNLVPADLAYDLLAAAVVVAPADASAPAHPRFRVVAGGEATIAPPDLLPRLARNPQAGLVDLVDAIARGKSGRVRLDRGAGAGWCAEIERIAAG